MLKKSASGVLGSSKASTYPKGYASGFDLPAALLDSIFEHSAGPSLSCSRLTDHRSATVPKWFLLSLLAVGDPSLTVRFVQMIEDIVGFC